MIFVERPGATSNWKVRANDFTVIFNEDVSRLSFGLVNNSPERNGEKYRSLKIDFNLIQTIKH